MTLRTTLFIATGAALVGAWLARPSSPRAALPQADGPVGDASDGSPVGLAADAPDPYAGVVGTRAVNEGDDETDRSATPTGLAALQDGMPADRSSDADRARPGFADYARGA